MNTPLNTTNNSIAPASESSALLVARILWAVLLGSQLMYLFAIISTSGNYSVENKFFDLTNPITMPLALMSLFCLLMGIFLPNLLWKNSAKTLSIETPWSELVAKFFAPFIIRLALFESIVLFGFVLGFISHDYYRMLPFFAVSVIGFSLNFPTVNKVRSSFKL